MCNRNLQTLIQEYMTILCTLKRVCEAALTPVTTFQAYFLLITLGKLLMWGFEVNPYDWCKSDGPMTQSTLPS